MNIITVTLNPAIDVHIGCEKFAPGKDTPYVVLRRDSGGKGVNISRALTYNGYDNLCYVVVGEENAQSFLAPLLELGMRVLRDTVSGSVRENLNIHSPECDTVLAGEGVMIDKSTVALMEQQLSPFISSDTYICFSGRITAASDKEAIICAIEKMKNRGAKIILDSRSFNLEDLIRIKPYLIKPNAEEITELTGEPSHTYEQAIRAGMKIFGVAAENILITLGAGGAVYICESGAYILDIPEIKSVSTTGAGDSSIAGFLVGIKLGYNLEDTLKQSMAYGAAACLREGTMPPKSEDIKKLIECVEVEKYIKM